MARPPLAGRLVLGLLLGLGSAPELWGAKSRTRVIVLLSHDSPPYQKALAGVRKELAADGVDADTSVVRLNDTTLVRELLARTEADPPAVILPLGTAAIRAVAELRNVPVVAAMALRPADIPRAPNVTGVALEFPPATYVEWLHKVLPHARSIAVVYSPAENEAAVEEARGAASRLQLRLDAAPAPTPRDIPRALEQAAGADVLLGLTDGVVYTPETARGILLFSFRNRVPLVGPPGTWVQAGALFGLDRDYEDVGRQAGEMAARILRGATPASLAVATPRKVCPVFNLNTAEKLGIELSRAMLAAACREPR